MLNNIIPRQKVVTRHYERRFYIDPYGGLAFPCDAEGNVLIAEENPAARANYESAMAHPEEYQYAWNELHTWQSVSVEPAHGDCACGEHIWLQDEYYGACRCPRCGRWYNLFGQELVPPENWEDDLW